jgi:hypothetical protein
MLLSDILFSDNFLNCSSQALTGHAVSRVMFPCRRPQKDLLVKWKCEPGSSVSIVSGYVLYDRAVEVRSPTEAKGLFFYRLCPDRLWGPPSLLYSEYRGLSDTVVAAYILFVLCPLKELLHFGLHINLQGQCSIPFVFSHCEKLAVFCDLNFAEVYINFEKVCYSLHELYVRSVYLNLFGWRGV